MHLGGGGEYDWSSVSESSSEELSVTSRTCASSDSIVYSEDLVSTPDFSMPVPNGWWTRRVIECTKIVDKFNT